jgi:hypothetical protein
MHPAFRIPAFGPFLLLALAASCGGGSGGGTQIAPPAGFAGFEFDLRRDVAVNNAGLAEGVFADLNGDGTPDLVSSDFGDQSVAIGLSTPQGGLVPTAFLSTPGHPATLAVADCDGDGRPDIAVACFGAQPAQAHSIALFQQTAVGSFLLRDVYPLPSPSGCVRAGELLGDGRAQLIVSQELTRDVLVLRASASAQLELVAELDSQPLGAGQPHTSAALDLDADGLRDVLVGEVLVSDAIPDRVVWYRSTAPGVYAPAQVVLPFTRQPVLVPAGDTDGDGLEDLLVTELEGDALAVLRPRSGDGPQVLVVPLGVATSSGVLRDLDGDGLPELAATVHKQQAVLVRAGIGPDQWGPARLYNVGTAPRGLVALALAGDELLDLACVNAGDASLLENDAAGGFIAARGRALGFRPSSLHVADLDGDGSVEALTPDLAGRRLVLVSGGLANHDGAIDSLLLDAAGLDAPGFVASGDLDGDGLPEILCTMPQLAELRVLRNQGELEFALPGAADRFAVEALPTGLALADVDGDGELDAVVACSGARSLIALLGDGRGALAAQAPLELAQRPVSLALRDLDGDGDPELVVGCGEANGTANEVLVFEGLPGAGFALRAHFATPVLAAPAEFGDFDLDGRTDLVLGQPSNLSLGLLVLRNQGNLAFGASTVPAGFSPASVSVADVDLDGRADLVCPLGGGQLKLLLGDGQGSFPEQIPTDGSGVQLPVPYDTSASAYVDVDNDGLRDLVLASPSSAYLWIGRTRAVPAAP